MFCGMPLKIETKKSESGYIVSKVLPPGVSVFHSVCVKMLWCIMVDGFHPHSFHEGIWCFGYNRSRSGMTTCRLQTFDGFFWMGMGLLFHWVYTCVSKFLSIALACSPPSPLSPHLGYVYH